MPKRLAQLTVVPRRTPQLQLINEKIARLAAVKPWNDIYRAFSVAAQLAGDAVTAAEELQQMPGASGEAIAPVLSFWYRARDYNYAAALAVAGGNQNLAEALVTFRLLQTLSPLEVRDGNRIVKAVAKAKELPGYHPHLLRHACATHMHDRGAQLQIVARLLGHAQLGTAQIYTRVSTGRMMDVYRKAHPHARKSG